MSTQHDLLIEIGTEELPPRALRRLSEAFRDGVAEGLSKAGLAGEGIAVFAAPRRLALLLSALPLKQQDREVERRGPALAAAFNEEGCPTQAAIGFAKSCGVEVEALGKLETDKGAWLVYRTHEAGQSTAELVPAIVEQALARLPIPKRMRWGASEVEFVRPVQWIVLLFGNEVIKADILGVPAGRHTRGHRFHHPANIYIGEPAAYAPLLETQGKVIADFATRREAIRGQVLEAAAELNGEALIKEALLDEVTALVEWPVAVSGSFDAGFLDVPAEALISSMQDHQKYFPVVDRDGKLLPHFITIANIDSKDVAQVRAGNERVIRPRLSDAAFFWNQDRKHPLAQRIDSQQSVVFQKKLGTVLDKTRRVADLAQHIADTLGGDGALAQRAGLLAKCDLMTDMVGEFPELQGVMGRYYAAHDGEPAEVAAAIDEHYMPRFAGDRLAASATGQALAIADRIDTLVGIFGIGQPPTGAKDPFALRRAALGVLRTIIENDLDLELPALVDHAARRYAADGIKLVDGVSVQVVDFMLDRLGAYYRDAGIPADSLEAVLACRPGKPRDFDQRVRAVSAFRKLPEADSLAAANKRIRNILKKAGQAIPDTVDAAVLQDAEERQLAQAVASLATDVAPLLAAGDYTGALHKLAALREPVDSFFDAVMVMADDAALRNNRLALLKQLADLFLQVADVSLLQD